MPFLIGLLFVMQFLPLVSDPQVAWKELTIEHESVVRRVAQLEREFSIFQNGEGAFSRVSARQNAREMEPSR